MQQRVLIPIHESRHGTAEVGYNNQWLDFEKGFEVVGLTKIIYGILENSIMPHQAFLIPPFTRIKMAKMLFLEDVRRTMQTAMAWSAS